MPSMLHEGLLLLFRNRPSLAPELLVSALGVALPEYSELRLESSDLTQVVPTEYRADLVVLLLEGRPVLAIVVEVQLAPDPDKCWTWPVYVAALRARQRCPCMLLVVTADDATARWAAEPIPLGAPGNTFAPLVLGPSGVPIVTDPVAASAAPELAVLSAMAHGRDDPEVAFAVARAALHAAGSLDEERAAFYLDFIQARLGDAAKAALEALMNSGSYQFQSDFARKYFGLGKAEGEARGEARGLLLGRAESILGVLRARGLPASDEIAAKIRACDELATLDRWLARAVTAASADAVFAEQ